jgi:serine-type D-Ala-D-Ala carboxypeptidase/endopeptidase (penicillin-binding protein 4)
LFLLAALMIPVLSSTILMPSVPASWRAGIYVVEPGSGEEMVDISSSSLFRPASTLKLVTSYVGLDSLGPAFVWETELLADTASRELFLIGAGAPLMSAEQLEIMALETAAALPPGGSWHLYWDTSLFVDESHCPDWAEADWNRIYCPPIEALSVGDNIVQIIISTMGGTLRIWTYPDLPGLSLVNHLLLGGADNVTSRVSGWEDGPPVITLEGTVERSSRTVLYSPFAGPPAELAGMLAEALEETGMEISAVSSGEAGDGDGRITASVMRSEPLFMILASMNKWSRNMVAEMVLRTVSLEAGCSPASTGSGCDIAGSVLSGLAPGLPVPTLADGSGLSRLNSLTPRHLAALLEAGIASLEWGPEFLATLPVNGVDGTLSARLCNLPAGAFRGKTGSLSDTSCIAGLLTTASGRRLIVVVMLEVPEGTTWTARAWQDSFITWLWESY